MASEALIDGGCVSRTVIDTVAVFEFAVPSNARYVNESL